MPESDRRLINYLPAVYQEHSYLARFLAPFDSVLAELDALLSDIGRYFDPRAERSDGRPGTDADFLPWLATWVALVLDEQWDENKRREQIAGAMDLYRRRGTVQGLKDYLRIYARQEPDIREWRWPGGMQVGVASQVGSTDPEDAALTTIERVTRREPAVYYDYYVVDTIAPAGDPEVPEGAPLEIFYRADRVERVEVDADAGTVRVWRLPPEGGDAEPITHTSATISRRDHIIDEQYTLRIGAETDVLFRGDTFLVDEVIQDLPYRFTVDVRVAMADISQVQFDKVRAILDLEKPAHTMYYLKLTPIASQQAWRPVEVEVRSHVGGDTTVG